VETRPSTTMRCRALRKAMHVFLDFASRFHRSSAPLDAPRDRRAMSGQRSRTSLWNGTLQLPLDMILNKSKQLDRAFLAAPSIFMQMSCQPLQQSKAVGLLHSRFTILYLKLNPSGVFGFTRRRFPTVPKSFRQHGAPTLSYSAAPRTRKITQFDGHT